MEDERRVGFSGIKENLAANSVANSVASQPALRRFGRGGLCRGRDAGVAWRGNEKEILWRVHLPTTRYTLTTATDNWYDVASLI